MWDKNQPLIRSKIAIDLSHFRLLERIVATGRPALILEDDAQIDMMGKQWLPKLLTALQELPEVRVVAVDR
jgi:GR25 family glycosyltransferase involved in LPS biosynthesis